MHKADRDILLRMIVVHEGDWTLTSGCDVCYCTDNGSTTLYRWLNAAQNYAATLDPTKLPLRLCEPHARDLDLVW